MGKTTVVLEENLLKRAVQAVGAKSKREAIEKGLKELIRRKNINHLCEELGTFRLEISLSDLERMRKGK